MDTINSPHVIYGLLDPNTKELRYIGYTSNQKSRYMAHHSLSKLRIISHKNNWIKSLIAKDQKAEMIILERYQTAVELLEAEIDLIAYYKFIGCNLTNSTLGGDGFISGFKYSKARNLAISKSKLGSTHSEESKKKMSESHKGMTHVGCKHSQKTKDKLSLNLKGKTWSIINGKRVWS